MALVVILPSAACSGGSDPATTDGVPEFLTELDPAIEAAWESIPPFQRDLLADGDLKYAEYERAMQETIRCYEDHGLVVLTELKLNPETRNLDVEVGAPDTVFGSIPTVRAAVNGCEEQFVGYIRYVWGLQHDATPAERAKAEAMVAECVSEAGIDMPPIGTPEWGEWLSAEAGADFFDCVDEVAAETGVRVGA